MTDSTTTLTRSDIVDGLRALGLAAGDRVVVHSSLKAFGRVEGGPNTVIDALEEVITPAGTLVMPTFSSEFDYFLEALAARMEDRGQEEFQGSIEALWNELKAFADETNFLRFPWKDAENLLGKVRGHKLWTREGWSIGPEPESVTDVITIRKLTPTLPRDEIRPWNMRVTVGIIPGTFCRRPEAKRSEQFTGSFTAWGALTDQILERHDNHSHQELKDHPLHRLKEAGGKILMLGVDHRRNSTIHVSQHVAVDDRGLDMYHEFLGDFMRVDEPLMQRGAQTIGKIGNSTCRLADTTAMYEVIDELLVKHLAEGKTDAK